MEISALRQRTQAGEPKAQLAREVGISRETLYQYLRTEAECVPRRAVLSAAERSTLCTIPVVAEAVAGAITEQGLLAGD